MIRWLRYRRAARQIAGLLEEVVDIGDAAGAHLEQIAGSTGATLGLRAQAVQSPRHPEMWAVETVLVALDDPHHALSGHLPRVEHLGADYLRREHAEITARMYERVVAAGQAKARAGSGP